MGVDAWLNDEESDFAAAKRGYMAMGYSRQDAETQIKADCMRYLLQEALSGAAEGMISANMPRLTEAAMRGINELDVSIQRTKWKNPKKIVQMTREEIKRSRPKSCDYFENNGFVHVKNGKDYRVRIDPPDKTVKYKHIHVYDTDGNLLDINGNIVPPNDPAGHIPYAY